MGRRRLRPGFQAQPCPSSWVAWANHLPQPALFPRTRIPTCEPGEGSTHRAVFSLLHTPLTLPQNPLTLPYTPHPPPHPLTLTHTPTSPPPSSPSPHPPHLPLGWEELNSSHRPYPTLHLPCPQAAAGFEFAPPTLPRSVFTNALSFLCRNALQLNAESTYWTPTVCNILPPHLFFWAPLSVPSDPRAETVRPAL